ncbi:MAG: hypothetical protein H6738_16125 [Alphaproteobacteria bacterium]|nr:hypothetical protein [Alphaproteobacteria bacterium]MCB9698307.1 hypothetical protein [Alphaproteobacteria bacterium]
MTPVVVPVHLGCCPGERCLCCGPRPSAPTPELVEALVAHYREERASPGRELRVGFFGGAPPDDALIDAIGGLPFGVRVRPDLLTRARVAELSARGADAVELDAWTLADAALADARRPYRSRLVLQMLAELPTYGVRPGVVLAPGLPRTDHATALADARAVAPLVAFARVQPVLVLDGSDLRRAWLDGTYVPLALGQAVTTARAVVDVLDEAGVEVVRVGANPVHDGLGKVVAGPFHPSFRQLVDARRRLEQLRDRLGSATAGSVVRVRCHPADETITRGPLNQHVRTLRAAFRLADLRIHADEGLQRGAFEVDLVDDAAEVA